VPLADMSCKFLADGPVPDEVIAVLVVRRRIFGVERDADRRIELELGVRFGVGDAPSRIYTIVWPAH